jgi:hypothetical protein
MSITELFNLANRYTVCAAQLIRQGKTQGAQVAHKMAIALRHRANEQMRKAGIG